MMKLAWQLIVITIFSSYAGFASGQALEQFLQAVQAGDTKVVGEFLAKGVDPNTADPSGNTALMLAARMGHENLVALLLERKAGVNVKGSHGDSALMMASMRGHVGIGRLLVEKGAEVNPGGWTPLHYAAFEGKPEMVRFLLDKGARKDAVAPNGYTALMLAARGGHVDAARVLLHEDADFGAKGPNGETALGLAKLRNDKVLQELLRRAGAVD